MCSIKVQAAAQVSDKDQKTIPNWIEKNKDFVANNDCALQANLLPNVAVLLSHDKMQWLAF